VYKDSISFVCCRLRFSFCVCERGSVFLLCSLCIRRACALLSLSSTPSHTQSTTTSTTTSHTEPRTATPTHQRRAEVKAISISKVTLLDESKKKDNYGYLFKYLIKYKPKVTNREQRILLLLMNNRKEWLKTDKGRAYKQRTNKNYRQKKQQTKKDNLKVNKSFEFHFPIGTTLKE
jgi:hypothetical protein